VWTSANDRDATATIGLVALDPTLHAAAPTRFESLLAAFRAGYARTFAGDEAESDDAWEARILGRPPPQPVMRIVVVLAPADGHEHVIGGAAVEYYRASGCALLTYLYVDDAGGHRRRGLGRRLGSAAREACAGLGPMHALLAEAEWPAHLPQPQFTPDDVARAQARLGFFARIGARAIDVDYVQPALGPGRQPVPWLRLLLLPAPLLVDDERLRTPLALFLDEFHAALSGQNGLPVDCARLACMKREIAAARPLTAPLA
jgi:GNAT superfamily N-acetyltransferase